MTLRTSLYIRAKDFCFLGLVFGSFLNVLIYRLPRMLMRQWQEECQTFLAETHDIAQEKINLWWPPSHCPSCKNTIMPWQNIPLISFILQKGQCSHCHEKISWRYPVVEGLTTLLLVWIFCLYGLTITALGFSVLTLGLIALAFIDLDEQILPDNITLALTWLGLLFSLHASFIPPEDAIFGAAVGYGSLWLLGTLYRLLRHRDGIGYGDYKLFAVFGAWFGWQPLPFILLFASIVGAIIGSTYLLLNRHSMQKPIPFGPYLCLAAFSVIIYPHWMQFFYQWIGP